MTERLMAVPLKAIQKCPQPARIMAILKKANDGKQGFIFVSGLTCILLLGLLDLVSGTEISFASFYVLPVCFVVWRAGFLCGLLASVLCALTWSCADYLGREIPPSEAITLWNGLNQLFLLVIISSLLSRLNETLKHERTLSRRDPLTGAANKRAFTEKMEDEAARAQRHPNPLTLGYIDLDNFKAVNDEKGHSEGDRLLQVIVSVIQSELRRTDLLARLGGDEFAILLPETGYETAASVIHRIRDHVLLEMQQAGSPVTLSIGALTCDTMPHVMDEILKQADALMYSVKRRGKNGIHHEKFAVWRSGDRGEHVT
jgi:diguanylate cyclase (GGDEF)-like protein